MRRGRHPHAAFNFECLLAALPGGWPTPTLPIDWAKNLTFPTDGNDQYGDCMMASACHLDNTWTGNNGTESTFAQSTLIQQYLQMSGGDNGLDDSELIPVWQSPGIAGVSSGSATILDTLSLDPTNSQALYAAIWLFGGFHFELSVPDAWINNFQSSGGSVWDAPARPDPRNGHAIAFNGVDATGRIRFLTWGSYGWLTPAGIAACDPGGFVPISLRWFNAVGYAPNGLHYTQLAPLWQAAGGKVLPPSPFPAPGPTPTPTPGPTPTPTPGPTPTPTPGPTPTPATAGMWDKPSKTIFLPTGYTGMPQPLHPNLITVHLDSGVVAYPPPNTGWKVQSLPSQEILRSGVPGTPSILKN
jgi:hypothetical protein